MTQEQAPLLTERRGATFVITLNRPDLKNAANLAAAKAMEQAMNYIATDPELLVGVITGAGGSFCSGGDFAEGVAGSAVATKVGGLFGFFSKPPDKTLIAAIEGFAVGGGLELALACDVIVASREARLGLPDTRHGMMALGGGLVLLPRRLPFHIARDMVLSGDLRTSAELAVYGLVSRVCEPGDALRTALDLAERLCRNGPIAVTASRHIATAAARLGDETAVSDFQASEISIETLQQTEDFREGASAFLEKRVPAWRGR